MKTLILLFLSLTLLPLEAMAAYVPNPVTTNGTKQRLEWAIFNNLGAVTSSSSSWVSSSSFTTTGDLTINVNSGTWSASPACSANTLYRQGVASFEAGVSNTVIHVYTYNAGIGFVSYATHLICVGPR